MTLSKTERFTCPRRSELGQDPTPNQDRWERKPGEGDLHVCEYCGSLAPDEFMQAVRDGHEIGLTDKNYKAYVDSLNAKFYFQHLSRGQQDAFIELYNDRTMKIGWPGNFTVLPFFMAYVETTD